MTRLWLALLLCLWASAASADPGTLIVSLLGGTAALGTVGAAVVQLAVGLAVSRIAQQIRARQMRESATGIRTQVTTRGGTLPQTLILGRYATGGNIVAPFYAHGTAGGIDNALRTQVIDLADVALDAVTAIWVDGRRFGIAEHMTGPVHADYGMSPDQATRPLYAGHLWLRLYDGRQTTADAMLVAKYGAHPERPWTAQHIGQGVAYAVVTCKYDTDVWRAEPQVRFEVRGARLYDWRLDSTAGGSGPQRWNTPATWTHTDNPVVMAYNILRGIPLADGGSWGLGVAAADLPLAWWTPAANRCDETVAGDPRYRAGFEVRMATPDQGGDTPFDVLDRLLAACDGEVADVGGAWIVSVAEPGLPLATLTDDDLIADHSDEFDPFPPLSERYNAVRGTYVSPAAGWEAKESPPRHDTGAAAEDGRVTIADLDLPAVWHGKQVQRLFKAWLKDARRFRRHVVTLPPEYDRLLPFDTLTWSSGRNGYDAKLFRIERKEVDPLTLLVTLSLRERDPADYDWSPADELPEAVGSVVVVEPAALSVPGWQVDAVTITDAAGAARRPGIRIRWTADLPGVRSVRWQVRVAATDAAVTSGSTEAVDLGEKVISEGLLPATAYEVRGRLGIRGRRTDWTGWTTVTTHTVRIGAADLDPGWIAELDAQIDDVAGDVADGLADVAADIDGLRDETQEALEALWDEDIAPLIARTDAAIPRIATAEGALDGVLERLLGQSMEVDFLRRQGADAGISVDPATGRVRIAGVQALEDRLSLAQITVDGIAAAVELRATYAWVNNAIADAVLDPSQIPLLDDLQAMINSAVIEIDAMSAAITAKADSLVVDGLDLRIGAAELSIDALEGEILLRVTTTDFDSMGDRVGAAEVALNSLDAPSIALTVQDTRRHGAAIDDADLATLADLIGAYEGRRAIREATATAQLQLYSKVNDDLSAESSARLAVQAEMAGLTASVGTLYYTKVDADAAIAAATTSLKTQMEGPAGSVGLVTASLATNYYTKAAVDGAITAATTALKTQMEGPTGSVGLINSNLTSNYYTRTATDAAIAAATLDLGSEMQLGVRVADFDAGLKYWTGAASGRPKAGAAPTGWTAMSDPPRARALVASGAVSDTIRQRGLIKVEPGQEIIAYPSIEITGSGTGVGGVRIYFAWLRSDYTALSTTTRDVDAAPGARVSPPGARVAPANAAWCRVGVAVQGVGYSGAITAELHGVRAENASEAQTIRADLDVNYYTKTTADAAISAATAALKTQMEGPAGSVGLVTASLATNYYTKAGTDAAIAAATTALKTQMEGPTGSVGLINSNLTSNYYTRTATDAAIAAATLDLGSEMQLGVRVADFDAGLKYWTGAASGRPKAGAAPTGWTAMTGPARARALVAAGGASDTIRQRGLLKVAPGQEVAAEATLTVTGGGAGTGGLRLVYAWLDADYALIGTNVSGIDVAPGAERVARGTRIAPAGTAWARIGVNVQAAGYSGAVTADLTGLRAENIAEAQTIRATLDADYYTRTSTDAAITSALLDLDADYGRYHADGLLRIVAAATPDGALSRIRLAAAASAGEGTTRSAAITLEAITGNRSRALVEADTFMLLSGETRIPLFEASGGDVRLRGDRIRLTGDTTVEGTFRVTGPMINDGAVSATRVAIRDSVEEVTSLTPQVVVPAQSVGEGTFLDFDFPAGDYVYARNPLRVDVTGTAYYVAAAGSPPTPFEFKVQVARTGSSDWTDLCFFVLHALPPAAPRFSVFDIVGLSLSAPVASQIGRIRAVARRYASGHPTFWIGELRVVLSQVNR